MINSSDIPKFRAFQRQFDRIRKSSIGQQKVKISKRFNFDFKSKEMSFTFTGYDPELFQAQMPILRQFVLNDPINFGHICNLLFVQCERPELKAWVAEARKVWQGTLKGLPDAMHQHLHQVTDSLEDALAKLFYGYGGLFHVNVDDPSEEAETATVQAAIIQQAFPDLCWCLHIIDSVIYLWLDAPNDPIPSVTDSQPR